jgi:8-oxo-dGTP pyrophosphatase MutT (NUDIX family)
MLSWLARFIERHSSIHRCSLAVWKRFPPRLAGFLRRMLTTSWTVGAVAVMIDDDADRPSVLLVQHSYRTKGTWGLPGGSLESGIGDPLKPQDEELPDDVLESTLKREIHEELGFEIEVQNILRIDAVPYVPEEPGPYRLDFYYKCRPKTGFLSLRDAIRAGTIKPRSAEIRAIKFVPLAELATYDLYSSDARLLLRYLPRLDVA